jgi:hypothetical protein
MYVEDFNTFYQQAEELLLKDPLKTRYVVKYRHTEGKLVLKVTDDVVVSCEETSCGRAAPAQEGAVKHQLTCR